MGSRESTTRQRRCPSKGIDVDNDGVAPRLRSRGVDDEDDGCGSSGQLHRRRGARRPRERRRRRSHRSSSCVLFEQTRRDTMGEREGIGREWTRVRVAAVISRGSRRVGHPWPWQPWMCDTHASCLLYLRMEGEGPLSGLGRTVELGSK